MKGIAWYKVINPDIASICKIATKTLEDWRIKVISAPTIILKMNEEETLWI